jgi:hypothetical protein
MSEPESATGVADALDTPPSHGPFVMDLFHIMLRLLAGCGQKCLDRKVCAGQASERELQMVAEATSEGG